MPWAIMIRKIGGSLAAAICNVSEYKSRWDAYRILVENWKAERNLQMAVGEALEPLCASEYRAQRPGWDVYGAQEIERGEWARAHLDGFAVKTGEQRRVVEYKTASVRTMDKWASGRIPTDYLMQVQFYMWASGTDVADIGVLFGNERFEIREVLADHELQERMVSECDRFWREHVVPKIPPPIDGSGACAIWLREKYPGPEAGEKEPLREPTDEERQLVAAYRASKDASEQHGKAMSAIRNQLKSVIGTSRGISGVAMQNKNGVIRIFGEEK